MLIILCDGRILNNEFLKLNWLVHQLTCTAPSDRMGATSALSYVEELADQHLDENSLNKVWWSLEKLRRSSIARSAHQTAPQTKSQAGNIHKCSI